MGFESWTLWGMGLAAFGALIAIGLALLAQSSRFLKRAGLVGYQLERRARLFTGYGFALLLLAIGFFLAGVPLTGEPAAIPLAESTIPVTSDGAETEAGGGNVTPRPEEVAPTMTTMPVSGAFDAPPPALETAAAINDGEATETAGSTPGATTAVATLLSETGTTAALTPTVVAPTPTVTPTPTSTPTVTPTPTLTPAPIEGRTAVVRSGGNSVWIRRMPGGQALVMVRHNDTVILLSGRANQGGILWQEISTLDGTIGWIPAEFLLIE